MKTNVEIVSKINSLVIGVNNEIVRGLLTKEEELEAKTGIIVLELLRGWIGEEDEE